VTDIYGTVAEDGSGHLPSDSESICGIKINMIIFTYLHLHILRRCEVRVVKTRST
jgi:hypothetical protein